MAESFLVEFYPYDPVGNTIRTVGFGRGIARNKVAGSSTPFHTRLEPSISHEISVFENDIPSGSKLSIGSIAIKNADGKFNYLFGYEWGARQVRVLRGQDAKQYSDYTLVFDGSTMAINADRNTITFTVTEKASLIPETLQSNTYTGAGGAGGYADLKGVPKPLCFGLCKNIKPVLIDQVKQIWQVHDGTIEDIEGVFDGGVPLTKGAVVADLTALINDANKPNDGSFRYTLSGYFRLGAPPAKFINADVRGQFYSEVNLPDTIREIILARTPLTAGDLDGASFDALATRYPGRCSGLYYAAIDVGFVEWLENVIAALDSFWYFNAGADLTVKPFAFGTPVSTIRNERIHNLRRESSSRPLKEVEVLYDRNSEVIPMNEFTLVVQDLNVYVTNRIIRVTTDGSGNGGTYSYVGKIEAVMNGENVSDLGAVAFYCAASWLSISPDGSFTISNPGTNVAYADVRANYGEYTAGITIELHKSMGVTPVKQLILASGNYVLDYDQNGFPINPSETSTITASPTNVATPLVFTATDNVGDPVTMTGSGNSRVLTASTINNGPLSSYVDVRATSPDGTFQETRIILSRGSTGYFNPLSDLLTLADSKVEVYYQNTAPTTANEGDLWFDTDDTNKLYRRIGGTWTFINDSRIATALTNAATAQGTADGKITLYNTTSTPTATALGDLWYNPTTKALRTWNGATWELSSDITSFNTAAAITGQGYLALQNYADWITRVTGTGKPADNATRSLSLYAYNPSDYTVEGNTVTKLVGGWTSNVYSVEPLTGNFKVSMNLPLGTSEGPAMFGVTDTAGIAGDYAVGDYAWYNHYGTNTYGIYESGNGQGAMGGTVDANIPMSIEYDGSRIRYFRGTTLIREVASAPGRTFYAWICVNGTPGTVRGLSFTPLNDVSKSVDTVGPLTTFGSYSEIVGNTTRKRGGSHGADQGGVYGTLQKNTAFISARPIQGNTWSTLIGFVPSSGSFLPYPTSGNWQLQLDASTTGSGMLYIIKSGSVLASWSIPNMNPSDRMALIFNGRRVFGMLNGVVYGGDTSAYDATPGSYFYPTVWDYFSTGESQTPILDGIIDIRYGAWTDVRVYLDDGYTVLTQAGFRTIEGTANAITGQGPGATAPGNEVLNYQDTVAAGGSGITIIRNPVGGLYSLDISATSGYIAILLPVGFTNTMIRFAVDIFDYATSSTMTYIISGYNYSSGSEWYNCSATYVGPENRSRPVRFGYVGARCVIWIGETTDVWQYPKVQVRDLMVSYSNLAASSWKSGWTITIDTTPYVNITATIAKPRAGDAVYGESIFESASGATASLANFKTLLGTAAAIAGQGGLALRNNVDASTTDVIPNGSIPPMIANNGFTYSSTTSTITVSWVSMTIYRSNGTTLSIASGSIGPQGGLAANNTYRVYPYAVDNGTGTGSIYLATNASDAVGGTGWIYPWSGSIGATVIMHSQTNIPLGPFNVATTATGTGGGGGGGSNCIHQDTYLAGTRAGDLRPGHFVDTPTGPAEILEVVNWEHANWIQVYVNNDDGGTYTPGHILYTALGDEVKAQDLKLGDILSADGDHVCVTGLRLDTSPALAVGITIADPHLHYVGPANILCHNGNPKP